jgi:uncharacterized membrane protein
MSSLIITTLLFIIADVLYLGVARKSYFQRYFQQINGGDAAFTSPYFIPASLAVWLLLGIGVEKFVLPLAKNKRHAFLLGGLMGLIVYGVYDMTNLATINKWTPSFSAQDVMWGAVLTATVSALRK